jgi:hypothetical protein
LFDPLSKLLFTHLSRSHSFYNLHHLSLVGIELVPIPKQKHPGRKEVRSFVSIDKRMIPDDAMAVRRREFEKRWICEGVPVLRPISALSSRPSSRRPVVPPNC